MKVIVIDAQEETDPIGIYTFEGFQTYLNNLTDRANATNNYEGRLTMLLVVECNKNLNDMWDELVMHADYTCDISYYKGTDGKYHWCLRGLISHEEAMKKIEELMVYEDPKVKQLEAEIEAYQKRIEYLENHIKYMPEGEGAIAAKEHFICLAEGD